MVEQQHEPSDEAGSSRTTNIHNKVGQRGYAGQTASATSKTMTTTKTSQQQQQQHSVGKDDREIDNIALAKLLRDCAVVVEMGQFDSILYQALQDFRVYYKQKYPTKVKGTKSKDDGKKKAKRKPGTTVTDSEEARITTTTEVVTEVVKDETVQHVETSEGETKLKNVEPKIVVEETTEDVVENTPTLAPVAVAPESATVNIEIPTEEKEPEVAVDISEPTPVIVVPAPIPAPIEVPVVTPAGPVAVTPSPVQPTPVETAVPLFRSNIAGSATSRMVNANPYHNNTGSTTTSKFPVGNAVFGNFKGALFQTVKHATFGGSSKRNVSSRPPPQRDDLEAFQNELSIHAESSARRTAMLATTSADNNSSTSSRNVNDSKTRTFTETSVDGLSGGRETTSLAGGGSGGINAHARAAVDNSSYYNNVPSTAVTEDVEFVDETRSTNSTINPVDENAISNDTRNQQTLLTVNDGTKNNNNTPSLHPIDQPPVDDPSGRSDGASSVISGSQRNIDLGPAAAATTTTTGQQRHDSSDGGHSSAHSTRSASVTTSTTTTSTTATTPSPVMSTNKKPSFQRPTSTASALIANGWIEQQRRSKMRFVWKEVLASLVEGRKPGEETTLWIQREIINPSNGKRELEALHQIPVKFLQYVGVKHTVDHQFYIRLFNSSDEFVFRCCDAPMDSVRWVEELKLAKRGGRGKADEEEKKGPEMPPPVLSQQVQPPPPSQQQQPQQVVNGISQEIRALGVRDLRAMCHGAGINTSGMERSDLERAAEEVRRRGTYFDQRGGVAAAGGATTPSAPPHAAAYPPQYSAAGVASDAAAAAASGQPHFAQPPPQQHQRPPSAPTSGSSNHMDYASVHSADGRPMGGAATTATHQEPENRLSVKELRSICHGAGINTVGMERGELERAAEEVRRRGTYFNPPPGMHAPSEEEARARQEEYRRHQEEVMARQQEEFRRQEDLRRRQEQDTERQKREEEYRVRAEEENRRNMAEEEQRRREAEEIQRRIAEDEVRRRAAAEEEARRRAAEEEARRRAAIEEEARRKAAEEEARRRAAEAERLQRLAAQEQLRRQQEAQERFQQQQAAWQKQQQEEEHRRRVAEHQAAEQRRQHEEALRKQQQWAGANQSKPQTQPPQQQQWNQQHHNQAYPQQQHQPGWQQQQQQQQQRYPQQQQQQQNPNNQRPPQQNHQHHQPHQSAASQKYAKMANQTEDGGQAAITRIKHEILIQWALQPPQLQMLRPIDGLITTIHKVFPPALGVAGHEYFTKWTPIATAEIAAGASRLPDEEKLKKAVRKLRFFLHPDKLPRDLNEEQKFMTKMLWDVTSDAWDEFQKNREDLDWVTG